MPNPKNKEPQIVSKEVTKLLNKSIKNGRLTLIEFLVCNDEQKKAYALRSSTDHYSFQEFVFKWCSEELKAEISNNILVEQKSMSTPLLKWISKSDLEKYLYYKIASANTYIDECLSSFEVTLLTEDQKCNYFNKIVEMGTDYLSEKDFNMLTPENKYKFIFDCGYMNSETFAKNWYDNVWRVSKNRETNINSILNEN